jgi:FKBP-type peptidyl-prolyl cis-trans isomerase
MKLFLTMLSFSISVALFAQKPTLSKKPTAVSVKPGAKPVIINPIKLGTSRKDSVSYAIGQLIMNRILNQEINQIQENLGSLNESLVRQGLQDFLRYKHFSYDPTAKMYPVINKYGEANQKTKESAKLKQYEPLIKKGNAFLDSVAKTPGAVRLPSGLIYKIKKDTIGPKPKAENEVSVYYNGTLIDGTKFDGNMGTGNPPISFPLTNVIRGWTEGLQLMSKGAVYAFYIPYDIAYGIEGRPPQIPPVSVLVFDIELVDIKPAVADQEAGK